MLHSVKIWAAFSPYFCVSIFSLLPYTCNRSRIGSKCRLHVSFRPLYFFPSYFDQVLEFRRNFARASPALLPFRILYWPETAFLIRSFTSIIYQTTMVTVSVHFLILEDMFLPHCSNIKCRCPILLWVLHSRPVSASISQARYRVCFPRFQASLSGYP